jgi:hypothetical protein
MRPSYRIMVRFVPAQASGKPADYVVAVTFDLTTAWSAAEHARRKAPRDGNVYLATMDGARAVCEVQV